MADKINTSITVITTALNEEGNVYNCLLQLHEFLKTNVREFEIIFIDDGSSDLSFERARQLSYLTEITFKQNSTNRGVGSCIRDSIPHVKTDFFCWLPTDLEFSPDQLLEPLKETLRNDIVITYPINSVEQRTRFRTFLSRTFTAIVNFTFSHQLKYYNGITLYRRSKAEKITLKSDRFFCHVELLVKILSRTQNYTEIPVLLSKRPWGKSNAIRLKVFLDIVSCYFRLVREQRIVLK